MSIHTDPREPEGATYRDPSLGRDNRSVTDVLSDLVGQMTALFRTEANLFKAEMRENARTAAYGGAEIGAGAMIIFASIIILLIALVHAIEAATGLGFGWSSLIVGVVFALIGALLLKRGKDNLTQSPVPDRTTRSIGKDVRLVKEEAR
jgi:hypothetical protein